MKRIFLFVFLAVLLTTCKKEPATGNLLIITEYLNDPEPDVKCYLYTSWENYNSYTFFDQQISDDKGEVFFTELDPGWYYYEGDKEFSSLFAVRGVDSVLIESGLQTNKRLILYPKD